MLNMPAVTRAVGTLLIMLGIGGYLASGRASTTALIPAAFGLVFLSLGFVAKKESIRMHVMHGAILVALLGIGGTFRGFLNLPSLLSGAEVERPMAVGVQGVTFVLFAGWMILAIKSFVDARLNRKKEAGADEGAAS